MSRDNPTSTFREGLRRLVTFAGLTALGVGVYLWLVRSAEEPRSRPKRERGQAVRVIVASEVEAVPRVVGYGEVQSARTWQGMAEVGGTIVEMNPDVQVGRIVRQGDVLFEIDPEELELEKQRSLATVKGVRAQIAELETRENSARSTLAVERKVLELAQKELERTQTLYHQGNVPLSEVETAQASVLGAEKAVVSLENTLAELPASRRILQAQLDEVRAGLTGAELVLSRATIEAPFTMRIRELSATAGQSVSSGQVLVVGEGLDLLEVTARLPIGGIDPLLPDRSQRPLPTGSNPAGEQDPPSTADGSDAPSETQGDPDNEETTPSEPTDEHAPDTSERPRRGGFLDRLAEVIRPTVRLRTASLEAAWPARFSRFAGVDPLTRTTGVVVELDRSQRRAGSRDVWLGAGMHVSVELVGAAKPGCLALPVEALHDGVVYVADEEDRLQLRPVQIDWSQEDFACLASGLAAGDRVIVSDVTPAVEGMLLAPTTDEFETKRLAELVAGPQEAS